MIKHCYNCCTKPSVAPAYIAENILNRGFYSDRPNGKWVTDVSGFKYGSYKDKQEGKIYLSVILALCDRHPVACVFGNYNDNPLVLKTFDKAIEKKEQSLFFIVIGSTNICPKNSVRESLVQE